MLSGDNVNGQEKVHTRDYFKPRNYQDMRVSTLGRDIKRKQRIQEHPLFAGIRESSVPWHRGGHSPMKT